MVKTACLSCGQSVPEGALSCPNCHQLVHAARLEEITKQAQTAEARNGSEALLLWREALSLLPPESKQSDFIRSRIAELGASVRLGEAPKAEQPVWIKRLGPFAAVGAILWKFKVALLLVLGKAKFLLLGLGKLKTLLTMLASMGLYWNWFGWQFAVGFVLAIYVHEMGHVWALKRIGLRASAPMFIPGFGAFVSLYDSPPSVHEDARIGLAGPLWGAAAGVFCALVAIATGSGLWFAVARATALINLFNLTPIWQLDGGRGFRALAYPQRLALGGLFILLWAVTGEGLFFILTLGAAYRIFWQKDHAPEGDQTILVQFGGLTALFALMMAAIPIRQ